MIIKILKWSIFQIMLMFPGKIGPKERARYDLHNLSFNMYTLMLAMVYFGKGYA